MWFHKAQGSYSIGSEKFAIKDNTLIYVSPLVLHDMALEYTDDHERFSLSVRPCGTQQVKISHSRHESTHWNHNPAQ